MRATLAWAPPTVEARTSPAWAPLFQAVREVDWKSVWKQWQETDWSQLGQMLEQFLGVKLADLGTTEMGWPDVDVLVEPSPATAASEVALGEKTTWSRGGVLAQPCGLVLAIILIAVFMSGLPIAELKMTPDAQLVVNGELVTIPLAAAIIAAVLKSRQR
jgi:hypothetical protein